MSIYTLIDGTSTSNGPGSNLEGGLVRGGRSGPTFGDSLCS